MTDQSITTHCTHGLTGRTCVICQGTDLEARRDPRPSNAPDRMPSAPIATDPYPLDRATVTRKRNRKGGTTSKVTGHLLPDGKLRLALDREADRILLAAAAGEYEPGTVPVDDPSDLDAAYETLAADGIAVGIPFKQSFAQVVGLGPISRRAWQKLSAADRDELCATVGTDCAVARHTANLDPFTASAFDRELLTATRERKAHEPGISWYGYDGYRGAVKGKRRPRGWVSGESIDGSPALVGPIHPDGRVFVGHECVTRPRCKRSAAYDRAAETRDVRAELVAACAQVLTDRQSVTVNVNGRDVALAATSQRGGPVPTRGQVFLTYNIDGARSTVRTPAGAARAILSRLAA